MAATSLGSLDGVDALSAVRDVPLDDLLFDEENPRLIGEGRDEPQAEILQILWRDYAVDEVALSIANNGFFRHEFLYAEYSERLRKWVVIEGNRRLAAVKLLVDAEKRKAVRATDLPSVTAAERRKLSALPIFPTTRAEVWKFLGFRHINGPQVWQSHAKAEYIAWVHNQLNVPLQEIGDRIGDRHSTVARLYRGLMVLEQAQEEGTFDLDDRWKKHFSFSHLYTGLDYPGIAGYIGISQSSSYKPKPVPKAKLKQLGRLMMWLYGSKSQEVEPVVQSQNPHLRILAETLSDPRGVSALEGGLSLKFSQDISRGDEELLRENLLAARVALQEARGKVLTGFTGQSDLYRSMEEIEALVSKLIDDMDDIRKKKRSVRAK